MTQVNISSQLRAQSSLATTDAQC